MDSNRFAFIPNALSITRIAIAVSFPFLPHTLRFNFLIFALATEYLDGALARKFDWVTSIGSVLDPIADRALAFSVGFTFLSNHLMKPDEFFFIFFRDITVAAGFLFFVILNRNVILETKFQPNLIGKITTAFQYLVLINILLVLEPSKTLIFITEMISILSAIIYTVRFFSTPKHQHESIP